VPQPWHFTVTSENRATSSAEGPGYGIVETYLSFLKPTLLFVRGGHHLLPMLGESGVTGFSLDWRTEWDVARSMYPKHLLQGNIDPVLLLGSADVIRQRTRALLETMKRTTGGRSCILNLGHGILPGTPPETVAALCDTAAEFA
jgi:uroporphyrinogen decarboxylase